MRDSQSERFAQKKIRKCKSEKLQKNSCKIQQNTSCLTRNSTTNQQRWSRGHKTRGQGEECSRPRPMTKDTNASALQKKGLQKFFFRRSQKKGLQKFFSGDLQKKNNLEKNFQPIYKILTIQKIVLSSSRVQGNFRGVEVSKPWTSKCILEAKDVLENSTSANQVYFEVQIQRKCL